MNQLSLEKQSLILQCLVEGSSIRSTCRITGTSKNTVLKFLIQAGQVCEEYQTQVFKKLPCRRVEVDEIWSFVHARKQNVPTAKKPPDEAGDVWTWVAICADTKLVSCCVIGNRSDYAAYIFMQNLKNCLKKRIQLTSDGFLSYPDAVRKAFGGDVDYAQLIKNFSGELSIAKTKVCGKPKMKKISTSYVERCNLTMRMGIRRYTRKTNGFSKKIDNHGWSVALHFFYYNFCRPHLSLKGQTPAMAVKVYKLPWTIRELAELIRKNYYE